MLCRDEHLQWKKILLNINVISILAGALLFFTGIRLPKVPAETIDMMADMIGPMGMLLAGMAISETPLKDVFARIRNYIPLFLRLCLSACHPACYQNFRRSKMDTGWKKYPSYRISCLHHASLRYRYVIGTALR